MKKLPVFFMFFCLPLFAQHALEVKPSVISQNYLDTLDKIRPLEKENPDAALVILDEVFASITSPYERFSIYFWWYAPILATKGDYQAVFNTLKKGQSEGLYFPLRTGERKWPEYIKELELLNEFQLFLEENNRLRTVDQEDRQTEFFFKLPENYNPTKTYPLLIGLTGGFGSHIGLTKDWRSQKLTSDFIIVYTQGLLCQGSYLFSYDREKYKENIRSVYEQVVHKYAVDTTRVLLGGPSAGGAKSLILTFDGIIPSRGLILGFPVIPKDLDVEKVKQSEVNRLRIAMITGENDFGIKKQKEAAVLFDQHELPNRFLIYPEKGHEYPDDFARQIDLSLDFIFAEEND